VGNRSIPKDKQLQKTFWASGRATSRIKSSRKSNSKKGLLSTVMSSHPGPSKCSDLSSTDSATHKRQSALLLPSPFLAANIAEKSQMMQSAKS